MGPLEFKVNPLKQFSRDYVKVANDTKKGSLFYMKAHPIKDGEILQEELEEVKFSHKQLWLPPGKLRKVFFSFAPNRILPNKFAVCSTQQDLSAPVQFRVCSVVSIRP